jgi:peptidyl-prolyl cis-trans isomerase D
MLKSKDRKAFAMIYIFRKEMKKWHTVLWVVFAALALGSGFGLFFGRSTPDKLAVGKINGEKIYFSEYRSALKRIMAPYMQLYGMSEEKLLSFLAQFGNLDEMALNVCIEDKILDDIRKKLKVTIDKETFNSKLIQTIPGNIIDENGKVDIDTYHHYLKILSVTPTEYEKTKAAEFKREVVLDLIANSYYQPEFITKEIFEQENIKKNFEIAEFDLNHFLIETKKSTPDLKSLEDFFQQNKEHYRVPDKSKAKYWELPIEEFERKIEIDEQSIKNFYDKNRSSLFRIPPKVKVRKILIKKDEGGHKKAEEIHQKAKQNPEKFAELAKQYSKDTETAKTGGLIDFFNKGKYDEAFETAAFKLTEPNQISDIIVTKDGFEIIQLVERIKAIEKPLETVKNEIVNSLRSKRAVAILQGDLGLMMHKAIEDANALEKYAKEHSLLTKETGWISESDITDADTKGQLAQRLFSAKKQERSRGYFKTTGKYIIYQVSEHQKSYLPNSSDVKNTVINDFFDEQAKQLQQKTVSQIKTDILNSKITLKDAATRKGFKVFDTGFVKKGDKIQGLNEKMSLLNRIFMLSDSNQVLQDLYEDDYYLVVLKDTQKTEESKFEEAKIDLLNREKLKESRKMTQAFIASLLRNAKIDIDKKALSMHKNITRDI